MHRMFLYPSVKAGHWETKKAGYKDADIFVYMVRATRPALMLSRKCAIRIGSAFLYALNFVRLKKTYAKGLVLVRANCDNHRKTQLW